MTNIPKLREEAEEKAAEAIAQSMRVGTNPLLYLSEAKAAITTFCNTIAQGISEEDERKAFEKWCAAHFPSTVLRLNEKGNISATYDSIVIESHWLNWQAALRACPYRKVICGDGK